MWNSILKSNLFTLIVAVAAAVCGIALSPEPPSEPPVRKAAALTAATTARAPTPASACAGALPAAAHRPTKSSTPAVLPSVDEIVCLRRPAYRPQPRS